jgi:aerobic-type carbon monoxide dehydrogenase small subunit (CoxS/CutS family)
MNRSLRPLAAAVLVAGAAAGSALAASTALDQYPTAEQQIKEHFRQNFGQASSNCGPGQINDISGAKVVSESTNQVTMQVDYAFSAKSLQNTNTCRGTQSATVTFDKTSNGHLSLKQMDGLNP